PRTARNWPVTPEVMNWGVKYIYQRYKLPVFITENGLSCNDKVFLDGGVHDPDRIDFLHRYLAQLEQAARGGADIRGYFHWSLTDNFEWNNGYKERFGLVFIDYTTQARTLKDSAAWYAKVAKTNGGFLWEGRG
ncbi:MAG: family 1 glycosylhydrolase, partial [Oscillospiraceae bacterium]